MKKNIILLLILLIIVFNSTGNLLAAENQDSINLTLAHANNINEPLDKMLHFFADVVKEASFGEIQIEVIGGGQIVNSTAEGVESAFLGVNPITFANLPSLTQYSDTLSALDLPFLFKDREHAAKHLSGPLGEKLTDWLLEESGKIRALNWHGAGFQGFYTTKPIRTIEDIQGMTMRVMDSVSRRDSMNSYGARAVAIAFQEVYGAFQQGVIEGAENNVSLVYTSKQWEVAPYFTFSNHFYSVNAIIINEDFFQSLTPDQQNILKAAAELSESYGRYLHTEQEKKDRIKMEEGGVTIIEMKPKDREKFEQAAFSVWEKYAEKSKQREIIETITGVSF